MSQPTPYSRSKDFSEQTGNQSDHNALNAELDALAVTIKQIITNLAKIQRDDGGLANLSVGLDQLTPETEIGLPPPENWSPHTNYILRQTVIHSDIWYRVTTPHTSTDTFDASKFSVVVDAPLYATNAQTAATTAEAAKVAALAAQVLAEAWAEGTLPGGAGTKSAKEWADIAAQSAVDLSNYYTKTETYSQSQIDLALEGKSDSGHTHAGFAPNYSPGLTGVPTAPTADGSNTQQIVNEERLHEVLSSAGKDVSILTGSIANGGTIPLPVGFTEEQCKWMVSGRIQNLVEPGIEELNIYANSSRVVTAKGKYKDTYGSTLYQSHSANYIIIGVK